MVVVQRYIYSLASVKMFDPRKLNFIPTSQSWRRASGGVVVWWWWEGEYEWRMGGERREGSTAGRRNGDCGYCYGCYGCYTTTTMY